MKKILLFLVGLIILYGCKDDREVTSPQSKMELNRKDYLVSVDKTPMPVGGMEVIQSKIVYPPEAKINNIQGKVHVLMFIDEKGSVVSAEVIKGVHHLLDRAALDAVKEVKFTPGLVKGEAVKTQIAVPIVFRLNGDSNKVNMGSDKDGDYYLSAGEMPEIVGGPGELMKKVVYPKTEKEKGNQGKVILALYINEKGELDKAEVVESLNENFDNAALNAVKETRFTAGKIEGKNVKTKIYIPILFKLQ